MASQPCPVPRRVGIVHKRSSAAAAGAVAPLRAFLEGKGVEVLVDERRTAAEAELVVVLGGDGTLIHAAGLLAGRTAPILGVNMGSLGFMTEVPQAEAQAVLEHVLAGNATASRRIKLRVHLHRGGATTPILDADVLNDVVIAKNALSPMCELEARASGAFVATYKCDGIIVATPTGSTAYSLAANGPILLPTMRGVVVAPICPHTLTQRPLVLPDDANIEIALTNDSQVFLSLDGQNGLPLERGDRVQVKQSLNHVLVVENPALDFFAILRKKLRWGER
jgi:NAD+ kinase